MSKFWMSFKLLSTVNSQTLSWKHKQVVDWMLFFKMFMLSLNIPNMLQPQETVWHHIAEEFEWAQLHSNSI